MRKGAGGEEWIESQAKSVVRISVPQTSSPLRGRGEKEEVA